MADSTYSSRIAWLAATLSEQRARITDLLRGMTGLGNRGAMKPSIFRKFIGMLDQVAEAKSKEMETLNRIEDVENIHHARRKNKQLRRAQPSPKKADIVFDDEPECERPARFDLIGLLALWYLMTRKGINHKKQGLTID